MFLSPCSFNPSLEWDPSRTTGILVCLVGAVLTHVRFPVPGNEFYSISGTISYISCILMLTFSMTSLYRISYFIQANLLVLAAVAFMVSMATAKTPIKERTD